MNIKYKPFILNACNYTVFANKCTDGYVYMNVKSRWQSKQYFKLLIRVIYFTYLIQIMHIPLTYIILKMFTVLFW